MKLAWLATTGMVAAAFLAATGSADDLSPGPLRQPMPFDSGHARVAYLAETDLAQPDAEEAYAYTPTPASYGGLSVGGWIDQGFTGNTDSPANRSNWPVGYNDFANQYQLNQLWFYMEKAVDTGGYGWDIGGRVDFNFGTDSRFLVADGLGRRWNGNQDYQTALPQLYAEVAYNDLSVKLGHFWSTFGYEEAQAPGNFFYSHGITFVTRQPRTFTGALGTYQLTDQWTVSAGVHRGWNNWEDENNELGMVANLQWTSLDEATLIAAVVSSSAEDDIIVRPNMDLDVTVYELYLVHWITDRLQYVIEHTNFDATMAQPLQTRLRQSYNSRAFGIRQYLFYDINERWRAGFRAEWVTNVAALRDFVLARTVSNTTNYCDLTWGMNWFPSQNLVVRPEVRLGMSDERRYADFTKNNQLLLALDVVWQF